MSATFRFATKFDAKITYSNTVTGTMDSSFNIVKSVWTIHTTIKYTKLDLILPEIFLQNLNSYRRMDICRTMTQFDQTRHDMTLVINTFEYDQVRQLIRCLALFAETRCRFPSVMVVCIIWAWYLISVDNDENIF